MKVIFALLLSCIAFPSAFAADLSPQTKQAFDRYVQLTEARLQRDLNAQYFLYGDAAGQQRAKLRAGEVVILPQQAYERGKQLEVPNGLVQDWLGLLFIPNTNIEQVRSVMKDYPAYKQFYKPEVIDSKLLGQNGNEYDIFLRLYKKQIVTVVLNGTYHVQYGDLDPAHMWVNSRSTRMAQVEDPDKSMTKEEPVGHDDGFLWALNSYWRFEQGDGGVYAQLHAVSLSRDLPFGLGFLRGFLEKFPKESMEATLRGTKRAVQSRGGSSADNRNLRHGIAVFPLKNLAEESQHLAVNRAVVGE